MGVVPWCLWHTESQLPDRESKLLALCWQDPWQGHVQDQKFGQSSHPPFWGSYPRHHPRQPPPVWQPTWVSPMLALMINGSRNMDGAAALPRAIIVWMTIFGYLKSGYKTFGYLRRKMPQVPGHTIHFHADKKYTCTQLAFLFGKLYYSSSANKLWLNSCDSRLVWGMCCEPDWDSGCWLQWQASFIQNAEVVTGWVITWITQDYQDLIPGEDPVKTGSFNT